MIIPAGFAQVNHFFTGAGMPRGAQITYGVEVEAGGSALQVATEMASAWETAWHSATPISVTHAKVRVKLGPNDTGAFADYTVASPGSYNTPVDAPQVAVLMTKHTALGGRHGVGRCFLPVVPEADTLNGGTIDPTALAALQTRATNWLGGIIAATHVSNMILLHNTVDTTATPITSLSLAAVLSTQRRRLRKVGGRRRLGA